MQIQSTIITRGRQYPVTYHAADSFEQLPQNRCTQAYGICYHQDKIILAYSIGSRSWTLVGGTIEAGETFLETLARELIEEANVKLLQAAPIGYQEVGQHGKPSIFQLRYCCLVEPIGPFEIDPAGGIARVEEVTEAEALQRLSWGEIGHQILTRAAQIHRLQVISQGVD